MNKLDVLDKGYVRLVDHMGTDVSVINAARKIDVHELIVKRKNYIDIP